MMTIKSPEEMHKWIMTRKRAGLRVGFVPTMGAFHEGHLSLIKQANKDADVVVVSIFVNPTQFGPGEDFDTYPRDLERDTILAEANGADVIFAPSVMEMYPDGPTITVNVKDRVDVLCGKNREGHFDGVATILSKLFNIVSPDSVYFGMKDAQQVAVVEQLIRNYHFPIKLQPCPTMREADGLAKSSRNIRLSNNERLEAAKLYQGLKKGKQALINQKSAAEAKKGVENYLMKHLALGTIEYIEILSYPDLTAVDEMTDRYIIAVAAQYEHARLIDNVIVSPNVTQEADRFVTNNVNQ